MHVRRTRRAAASLLVLVALVAAGCGRDEDEPETGSDATTTTAGGGTGETTAPPAEGGSLLDQGGFGDIETVCQDGDASGATDIGVTDDSIQVGVFTDKGFASRPGLNEEMYDAAVAFADWCNSHGGILGRELVIADRDAALGDYTARIIESCEQDFAMVGGGAVLDDSDQGQREACGLPSIPGYVVSAGARTAGNQVQPLPNPLDAINAGGFRRVAEEFPDLIDRFGTITSQFGSVLLVRDLTVDAVESLGYTEVFTREYNAQGESNWRPFVEGVRDADVKVMQFVGEPQFYGQYLQAAEAVGYRPDFTINSGNFYDQLFLEEAGAIAQGTYVSTQFVPFELADEHQAVADYLQLIEESGGKVALLGAQAMSAYVLFALAATECGSELTRACILEQAAAVGGSDWTGGGLHAPQDVAGGTVSPCFLLLEVTPDGFVVDEELTDPNQGVFNCDEANVVEVGAD